MYNLHWCQGISTFIFSCQLSHLTCTVMNQLIDIAMEGVSKLQTLLNTHHHQRLIIGQLQYHILSRGVYSGKPVGKSDS